MTNVACKKLLCQSLARAVVQAALLCALASSARADTIVVTGACTLANAISAANLDAPIGSCPAGDGSDTLVLTADVALTAALPFIDSDITLLGGGFTISRASAALFRILDVKDMASLTIVNATIHGGAVGSGISGGNIKTLGALTLRDSTVSGGVAGATSGSFGGGIAAFSPSSLVLERTVVTANQAHRGAGIYSTGVATVIDSTFSGNTASTLGGGLSAAGGMIDIRGSTFSANDASSGGGLHAAESNLEVRNSTFSGNDGFASGMTLDGDLGPLTVLLENVTIHSPGKSAVRKLGGDVTRRGLIVVGSCFVTGTWIEGGASFGCGEAAVTGLSATLANNGGPTSTHALLAGSNALNAAGACATAEDQRGALRLDSCDSGAFELGACFDDPFEKQDHLGDGSDDTCQGPLLDPFGSNSRKLCDGDWLSYFPSGATYEIETRNLTAGADTFLRVRSSCLNFVASDDDSGSEPGASKVTVNSAAIARIDIEVTEAQGAYADSKGYDLVLTCVANCTCSLGAASNHVVLMDDTVMSTVVEQACSSITVPDNANYGVIGPGHLTLRAGVSVRLGAGFAVAAGARLSVTIDQTIRPLSRTGPRVLER